MKPLTEQTFYELLEVAPDATSEAIESAFERAMQFYGPDSLATYTLADGAEARQLLEQIEEAYLTLSDPALRSAYDARRGIAGEGAVAAPREARPAPRPAGQLTLRPIIDSSQQFPWPGSRPDPDPAEPVAAEASPASAATLLQGAARAVQPAEVAPEAPAAAREASLELAPEASALASEPEGPEASGGEPEAVAGSEVLPLEDSGPASAAAAREAALEEAPNRPAEPAAPEAAQLSCDAAAAADTATPAPEAPEPGAAEERPEREELAAEVAPLPPETATAATVEAPVLPPREPLSEPGSALVLASRPERRTASPEPPPEPAASRPEEHKEEPRVAPKPAARMPDLPPHTVFSGEMLRRVREGRGLSVRELADRTKIGAAHIENIEADHYGALPPPVYLRGFLMLVARELRLDPLKVSKSYLELAARSAGR